MTIACKKTNECDGEKGTYYLKEESKKWLDFSQNESIGYIDSLGNEIYFSRSYFEDKLIDRNSCGDLLYEMISVQYLNYDCCPTGFTFNMNYQTGSDSVGLDITLGFYDIHSPNGCYATTGFNIDTVQIAFDTLDIANKQFYNVYKFTASFNTSFEFYFTKTKGVVAFVDSYSDLWIQND
jgi:hypothetical protein